MGTPRNRFAITDETMEHFKRHAELGPQVQECCRPHSCQQCHEHTKYRNAILMLYGSVRRNVECVTGVMFPAASGRVRRRTESNTRLFWTRFETRRNHVQAIEHVFSRHPEGHRADAPTKISSRRLPHHPG